MAKDELATLGDALETNLHQQAEIRALLTPLEEQEATIRAQLTKGLLAKGLKFVKTSSGLAFGLAYRKGYSVIKGRKHEAIEWAQKYYPSILTVGAADLNKVIKPLLEIPPFVEAKETTYLQVHGSEEVPA